MLKAFPSHVPHISNKTFVIAGILTTVYGLDELSSLATDITCLWLHHGRTQDQSVMTPIAALTISDWNSKVQRGEGHPSKGLIAVSFDQRNHGSRMVNSLSNEAWRVGNPTHAQDMFSIYSLYYQQLCAKVFIAN